MATNHRRALLFGAVTAAAVFSAACGSGGDVAAPAPSPSLSPAPSPSPVTLSVGKAGAGSGTVTSTPAGIDCGATCSAPLPFGTAVVVTAAAAAGSSFAGWSGDCTGQSPNVTLAMTAARNCVATFNLATVGVAGTSDECTDPQGTVTGHRVVKSYRLIGTTTTTETAAEVIGPTTRNGESVIESRERTTYTAGPSTGDTSEVIGFWRQEGSDFKTFAMVASTVAGGITHQTAYELSPYMLFPGAMSPGQSRTHSYARITSVNGGPPQTVQITETHRFNGFETVTVPAGTFANACSWTTTQNGFVVNFWHARGSGIPLKVQGGIELLSATIDGVPVAP